MKILVTGITGLLGSVVARSCWKAGHLIVGLHRRDEDPNLGFPVEMRKQDLLAEKWDPGILEGVDRIVHCAADTTMGVGQNELQDKMNIGSVKKLVDLSTRSGVRQFILISSANTIAPGTSHNPADETCLLCPDPEFLNYANSKITAESIVRRAISEQGLRAVIINPTFMVGPSPAGLSSNQLIRYAISHRFLFYPDGGKNVVDVRDVAQVVLNCIERDISGENYLVCNQAISYKELFGEICRKYNRRAVLIHIPRWCLRIAGRLGSIFSNLLHKPIQVNSAVSEILESMHYYSNRKIVEQFGVRLRKFIVSLDDCVAGIHKVEMEQLNNNALEHQNNRMLIKR